MATTTDKSSTIIDANLTLESVVDEETKGKIKEAVERGEAGLEGVSGPLRSVLEALAGTRDTHQWGPTPLLSSLLKELFNYSDTTPKTESGWLQSLPAIALNGIPAQWSANKPAEIDTTIPIIGETFMGFQRLG